MTTDGVIHPRWRDLMRSSRARRCYTVACTFAVAVAFALIFRNLSLQDIATAIGSANVVLALPALAALVMSQVLRVLRSLRLFARKEQSGIQAVERKQIWQGVIGGQFINWLSPVRIGDIWRIWRMAGGNTSKLVWSATCVAIEKSADAFVLAIMAFGVSFAELPGASESPLLRLSTTALGGILLASALSALTSSRMRDRLLSRLPTNGIAASLSSKSNGVSPQILFAAWLEASCYSAGIWMLGILANMALARGFGIDIGLAGHVLLLLAFQTTIVFSPIPGNVGLFVIVAMGIFPLFGIPQSSTVAFGTTLWIFVYGVIATLTVALIVQSLRYRRPTSQHESVLLGTRIQLLTRWELLAHILSRLESRKRAIYAYANAHALNLAYKDNELRNFFNTTADIVFCDGFGAKWGARIAGCAEPPERLTPTDWIDGLCTACAEHGARIALLGGPKGVAERAAAELKRRHADLQIVFTGHGFFDASSKEQVSHIVRMINESGANVLLVGMGQPRQERWLQENWDRLHPSVAITVGMLFSYLSGDATRGPKWMTQHGLEWISRLIAEPARMWRRYLIGNPLFLLRAIRQRIG